MPSSGSTISKSTEERMLRPKYEVKSLRKVSLPSTMGVQTPKVRCTDAGLSASPAAISAEKEQASSKASTARRAHG